MRLSPKRATRLDAPSLSTQAGQRRTRGEKLLGSLAAVGVAASIMSVGAFADRRLLTVAAHSASKHRRPGINVTPHRLRPARALAPGDRIARIFDLSYRGRVASVVLTVKARRRSRLTARVNGLRISIHRCSRVWKKLRRSNSEICPGKRFVVLKQMRVPLRRRLAHLTLGRHRKDHLRLVLALPNGTDNMLQNQSATLVYRFTVGSRRRRRLSR